MVYSGRTELLGLLGWPVEHSLSPRLHGFWLERYGIDAAYLPLPVQSEHLTVALRGLAALGFRGINVTVPHKRSVLPLCTSLDANARRVGAVNTILFEANARAVGSNTDGVGFIASLHERGIDPSAKPVLLIGAGGAARAIAAALLGSGCSVWVSSRRDQSATGLATSMPGLRVCSWPPWSHLGAFGLLVNASSGGMAGQPALEFDLSGASPDLVVADIVYSPRSTALLAEAERRGIATVEGIWMLLHQAAASFELWFGLLPAVDETVRRHVLSR